MKKIIFLLLSVSVFASSAFADCQLGENCDYINNDLMLPPPYLGTYKCTLNPGSQENVIVEVQLLTQNTISDPTTLVLSNDKKSDLIKVMRRGQPAPHEYLVNALRFTQTSVAYCEETSSNHCDVPSRIRCEQVNDQ